MSWTPVPWAVEGGALVGAEAGRMVAYVAARGNDGVMGIGDLKVTALTIPGAGVQVANGAAVIPNRSAGYDYQTYVAPRPVMDDTTDVLANGAGAARYDMVVARVENPFLPAEPWQDPTDVAVGPYVFTRVLTGVGAANIATRAAARAYLKSVNMSAIPLAGLSIPASTSSILQAHITDLRNIANPRRDRKPLQVYNPGAVLNLTAAGFVDWLAPAGWAIDVPEWASKVTIGVTVGGARVDRSSTTVNGTATGQIRARLGGTSAAPTVVTQGAGYDFDALAASVVARFSLNAGDTVDVPAAIRGTTQTLAVQGLKASGTKNLYADTQTVALVDVEFTEAAA